MRIHIVTADVQDKDSYRDYTTLPPEKVFLSANCSRGYGSQVWRVRQHHGCLRFA